MFKADLTNCDREPIHIPGKVQSHGFLIALDPENRIVFCSENIVAFTGAAAGQLLGKDLSVFTEIVAGDSGYFEAFMRLAEHDKNTQQANAYPLMLDGRPFQMLVNCTGSYRIMEFEPRQSDLAQDLQQVVGRSLSEILSDKNLTNLLTNAADQVRQVICYDRVMIYKFHEDGHGEVVAEAKNDQLESWMGLHYPASDIPQQARELYKKNLVRLIADVHSEPAGILTLLDNGDGTALDLTHSHLRAVSPIHIQYLKNMGVASSFSVSIIDQDGLWGLIACHNYTPRFINFSQRETAKLIGQVLSSTIGFRQQEEDQMQVNLHRQALEAITRNLLRNIPIEEALTGLDNTLLNAIDSTGALLYYENQFFTVGNVPDKTFLDNLIPLLDSLTQHSMCYHTEMLLADLPEAMKYRSIACGVLVCRLSKDLKEFMVWFRPEIITTVKWAGNPEKPVEIDVQGFAHISPRHSFSVWSQNVELTSAEWTKYDLDAVSQLRDEVNYALSRKATELRMLNEKLREAYAELDTFSYTISHDLKNPLTTIKSFAQLILRDASDPERVKSMANRIQGGAIKMQEMIDEVLSYSKVGQTKVALKAVNMQKLLDDLRHDLLISSDNPNLKIDIGLTPMIQGDELMVMQVFSNLLGNAVKYSSQVSEPVVQIAGSESDNEITYEVSDNGIGIAAGDHEKIFELFSRPHLGNDYEGSGVGLAIVRRILEKLNGKIWLESTPGEGTRFYVRFRKFSAASLLN